MARLVGKGDEDWGAPNFYAGRSPQIEYAWIADEKPALSTQDGIIDCSGGYPAYIVFPSNTEAVKIPQEAPESVEAPFAETNPADPHGVPQHSPGAKNDAGKIRASLLLSFPRALWAIATVADYGSRKYTRNGWEHVPEGEERYEDAKWRHLLMGQMEENDQESGLPHAWHAAWGVLATLELQLRKQEAEQ
jgi:hypothetical protein